MTQSGAPIEAGPQACPFVALEFDRDRRADKPDPRHRCYAEEMPAPRTIPHQQYFCLSPDFPACPVFQAWAQRAAADPVGGRPPEQPAAPGAASTAAALASSAAAASAPEDDEAEQETWYERLEKAHRVEERKWPDSMDASLPAAATGSAAESESESVEQLAAFRPAAAEAPRFAPDPDEAESDEPDEVPMPTFLNARSSRPRTTAPTQEQLKPEEVVPPWSVERRYRDAEPRGDSDGEGRFSKLLTMAAVVIILALGVATVVIVPGLLAGDPAQTSRPSFIAAPSILRSPLASSVAVLPSQPLTAPSGTPTELIPTPVPTPTPSPRSYKIQPGDTLKRIAREFGVSVDDILAANPQIPDPDHIEVGSRIVIPAPQQSPAP